MVFGGAPLHENARVFVVLRANPKKEKRGLILILIFILSYFFRSTFPLLLLQAFHLRVSKGLHPICWTGELANLICNLASAD